MDSNFQSLEAIFFTLESMKLKIFNCLIEIVIKVNTIMETVNNVIDCYLFDSTRNNSSDKFSGIDKNFFYFSFSFSRFDLLGVCKSKSGQSRVDDFHFI